MTRTAQSVEDSWSPVDALFLSWQPTLLRYARHLCGTPDFAEDLVQEAFLALCRKSAEGADIRNPRRWTLCVVRYQASKHLRDRRRHREEPQTREAIERYPAGNDRGAADAAPDALLQLLTPREREVLELRIREFKYEQIAAQLRISGKTVGTLLARARRKLQDAAHAGHQERVHGRDASV